MSYLTRRSFFGEHGNANQGNVQPPNIEDLHFLFMRSLGVVNYGTSIYERWIDFLGRLIAPIDHVF